MARYCSSIAVFLEQYRVQAMNAISADACQWPSGRNPTGVSTQNPYDKTMTPFFRNTLRSLVALIGVTALAGPELNSLPDGLQAHWTFED